MKFIWLLFTPTLLLQQSWITIYIIRNCLPSLKLSRFGNIIWKVRPILLTLLQIIRTLSIFLLPRYWPRDKHSGLSTFPSSILSSDSTLVILAPNWTLSLDNIISILREEYWLCHNQQSLYELLSSFSLLSMQLQLWIWTPYIKTFSWLFLVTQLLQNTPLQMTSGLWTQTVYSFLTTEFIYYLLATSTHVFSSTIMITSLLDILVKTKH